MIKGNFGLRCENKPPCGCTPVPDANARSMMAVVEELFPICRSITGDRVRQTLETLRRIIPLEGNEVPSGTGVPRVEHPRRLYRGLMVGASWISRPTTSTLSSATAIAFYSSQAAGLGPDIMRPT